MRKKLLYIVIIILMPFLCGNDVVYLLLDAVKMHGKRVAENMVQGDNSRQVLTIPVKMFRERHEKKEIWVNGSLYDISAYHISGDSVKITVFHDEDEEGVIETIAACFETNGAHFFGNNSGHRISKPLTHSFNDCKILARQYMYTGILFLNYVNNSAANYSDFYPPQVYSGVIKPPPRSLVAIS